MKTFALALGGGGARGLGHIAVVEALDEMGVKPVAIAGASMGALVGAAYAAGMTGKDIRHHVIAVAHNRGAMFRRLVTARGGRIVDVFASGFAGWTLVDAEKFVAQFLPAGMPEDFSDLQIPLTVATSDLYRRCEVPIGAGPLKPALAASIALPALLRPVVIDDRVLIDGGATNPLPFDHLRGRADVVVAVDISGEPVDRSDLPNPWEALVITVLVMANAIIREKLRHSPPDLMLRPNVGIFGTLDFMQASAILRAAEPIKDVVKEKLAALLH
jgi:NTE family protein